MSWINVKSVFIVFVIGFVGEFTSNITIQHEFSEVGNALDIVLETPWPRNMSHS
jgi:hypothetical protein